MANEIGVRNDPARGAYVLIRNLTNQVYDFVASDFVDWVSADYDNYTLYMTQLGTSGVFAVDFPSVIDPGVYYVEGFDRVAATPGAEGDSSIGVESGYWTGASWLPAAASNELLEADEVIRTDTTPWSIEYRRKGTGEVLLVKYLKKLDGTNLTTDTLAVGQKVTPP